MADRKVKAPATLIINDPPADAVVDLFTAIKAILSQPKRTPKPAPKKPKTAIRHELDKEARAKKRGGRG